MDQANFHNTQIRRAPLQCNLSFLKKLRHEFRDHFSSQPKRKHAPCVKFRSHLTGGASRQEKNGNSGFLEVWYSLRFLHGYVNQWKINLMARNVSNMCIDTN